MNLPYYYNVTGGLPKYPELLLGLSLCYCNSVYEVFGVTPMEDILKIRRPPTSSFQAGISYGIYKGKGATIFPGSAYGAFLSTTIPAIPTNTSYSISFWFCNNGTNIGGILSSDLSNYSPTLYYHTSQLRYYDVTNSYSFSTSNINTSYWNGVCYVKQYGNTSAKIYVNGTEYSVTSSYDFYDRINIGTDYGLNLFNGAIDCLTFWTRTLSPSEASLVSSRHGALFEKKSKLISVNRTFNSNIKTENRIKQTSTTSGTGNLTVTGTSSSLSFNNSFLNEEKINYIIEDNKTYDWELGIGKYLNDNQISRDYILSSSNSNNLVNFAANTKIVSTSYPANNIEFIPLNKIIEELRSMYLFLIDENQTSKNIYNGFIDTTLQSNLEDETIYSSVYESNIIPEKCYFFLCTTGIDQTINTDIIASISRDNGTNYETINLILSNNDSYGKWAYGYVDLTNQNSNNQIIVRIQIQNIIQSILGYGFKLE